MGAGRTGRLLSALAASAVVGCSGAGSERAARNVVFISIDTLRADRVGCYGQELPLTPNLDRLAAEGTRFENCTSSCPVTLPSHATMMTGTYPFVHGARNNGTFILAEENLTLAELLREADFATRAEISCAVLESKYGLDQGFEEYGEQLAFDPGSLRNARPELGQNLEAQRSAESVSDAGIAFLDSRSGSDEPFFLFLHYYDPHQPYDAPEPFASRHGYGYNAEIAYVDSQVGRVLDRIRATELAGNTLVVLTSDHGDGLGEHEEATHATFLYESTLHVPLIIWWPGRLDPGQVVSAQVGLVDLMPTVMELLGLPAPGDIQGTSLVPLLDDPDSDLGLATYSETLEPRTRFDYSELRGLNQGGWKYIHSPRPELYDLSTDRAELTDRAGDERERLTSMRVTLREILADAPPLLGRGVIHELSAEDERRLAALGYTSAEGSDPGEDPHQWDDELSHFEPTGDNPMDRTREIHYCYTGLGAVRDGNFEVGIENWSAFLEHKPDDVLGLSYLGQCYASLGRRTEAIPHLRRALELDPERCDDRLRLGAMLAETDQLEEARRQFEHAVECDPDLAMAATNLANACILLEDFDSALSALDAAAGRFPQNVRIDLLRAKALGRMGRTDEAIDALSRVLRQRPREAAVRIDLAERLQAGGRIDEARTLHEESLRILPTSAPLRMAAARFFVDNEQGARALEALENAPKKLKLTPGMEALRLRILATDADPAIRDGERAARLSERLLKGESAQDPRILAAAALVSARAGEIQRALDLAERARTRARERGAATLVERIEEELAGYRSQLPGQSD